MQNEDSKQPHTLLRLEVSIYMQLTGITRCWILMSLFSSGWTSNTRSAPCRSCHKFVIPEMPWLAELPEKLSTVTIKIQSHLPGKLLHTKWQIQRSQCTILNPVTIYTLVAVPYRIQNHQQSPWNSSTNVQLIQTKSIWINIYINKYSILCVDTRKRHLLAKWNSKNREVLPRSAEKSSYPCSPHANAATPSTMGSLVDLSLLIRGDGDCELLMLPCRMVHISRHPEADHTARPLFRHPTANARLSGVQVTWHTGPVSSTAYLTKQGTHTINLKYSRWQIRNTFQ